MVLFSKKIQTRPNLGILVNGEDKLHLILVQHDELCQ